MFIGHFAVGFAAKRTAPGVSLVWLFVAAQLADLLWPILVGLGIERVRIAPGITAVTPLDFISYPYSHSLLMLIVWGMLLGLFFHRAQLTIGALVVSHWILDWITHRPDMPTYPAGPKVGLGLWNHVAATIVIEVAMLAAGVWIYARATRPRDAIGRRAFAAFVGFLLIAYVANVFGPPPPSVAAIWISAIIGAALLIVWTGWIDRHREAVAR
jgi:hypothetical protein